MRVSPPAVPPDSALWPLRYPRAVRITKAHARGTSVRCTLRMRMLRRTAKGRNMPRDEFLDDLHLRILRVLEDLRVIQEELN